MLYLKKSRQRDEDKLEEEIFLYKTTQEPNNAEEVAGKILALIAKDPDSRAVHDFLEYACATLNITGEKLITASIEMAKKSERKTLEAESLPEIKNKFDLPPSLFELVCEKAQDPEDANEIYDILLDEIELQTAAASDDPEEDGCFPTIIQCALILEHLRHEEW